MNASRSTPGNVVSLPGWDQLLLPTGTALLERIALLKADGVPLTTIGMRLRAEVTDLDLLAAALTQSDLRAKAAPKFGELAPNMLFTPAGLEQASRLQAAELHAARFASSGCGSVCDLGSGLGAESLAFRRAGLEARAVEIDPLTAQFARHNLAVQTAAFESARSAEDSVLRGAPAYEVVEADVTQVDIAKLAPGMHGVFLDPARRTAGHRDTSRLHSAADYSPSLDFAFSAARAAHSGGVKLGPGFDRDHIPGDAEAQWVSIDGALVETGLWFGAAARDGIRRSALVMRGGSAHELFASRDSVDAEVRALGEYLIEPDGAVIRARLIGLLAEKLEAGMIHEGIAYLTSDRKPDTPFAQSFQILEELPSREKELKKALAARGIGRLEIKKRGVDVDPAALRTRLRLKGPESATLILTRAEQRHVALLAARC